MWFGDVETGKWAHSVSPADQISIYFPSIKIFCVFLPKRKIFCLYFIKCWKVCDMSGRWSCNNTLRVSLVFWTCCFQIEVQREINIKFERKTPRQDNSFVCLGAAVSRDGRSQVDVQKRSSSGCEVLLVVVLVHRLSKTQMERVMADGHIYIYIKKIKRKCTCNSSEKQQDRSMRCMKIDV